MSRRDDDGLTWLGHVRLNRGTPLLAGGGVYLAGLVANMLPHAPGPWIVWAWLGGLAFAALCGFVALLLTAGDRYLDVTRLYILAAGLSTGVYLTVAALVRRAPYHPVVWVTAAMVVFFSAVMWPAVRRAQYHHEQEIIAERRSRRAVAGKAEPTGPEPAAPLTREQKFEVLFGRAGAKGLTCYGEYGDKAGPVLHMRLPDDGSVTVDRLRSMIPQLEVVFGRAFRGMRKGAIRVAAARDDAGRILTDEVYVRFDLRDILRETIRIPDGHEPMSIYDAFPIGVFDDGEIICLTIHQIHAMIVGLTRKGKSNLLHVMILLVSRCHDALAWFVDAKNGATVRPHMRAYAEGAIDPHTGQPARPPLDWVAIDRFEAERLFEAAIAAGLARPGLRRGSKWRATAAEPAILVFSDEIGETVGSHGGPQFTTAAGGATAADLGHLLTRGVCLGAGEMVLWWMAGQRGTVTMFANGDAKSQLGGRMCFKVTSKGDASDVFQDDLRASELLMSMSDHPGALVVSGFGLDEAKPGKVYFAGDDDELDDRAYASAVATSHIRPTLDAGTAAAIADYGYADRWEDPDRTAWIYGRQPARPPARWNTPTPTATATAAAVDTPPAPAGHPGMSAVDELGLTGAGNPFALHAVPPHADGELVGDEAAEWERIERVYRDEMATRAARAQQPDPARPVLPPVEVGPYGRFVELVQAAADGITAADAFRSLKADGKAPRDRTTIYTWRDRAIADGLIVQPHGEGKGPLFGRDAWEARVRGDGGRRAA